MIKLNKTYQPGKSERASKGYSARTRAGVVRRLFLAHPAKVNETYLQHQRVALSFSAQLFGAAIAAAIHALVPALCQRTAGDAVRRIHAQFENRDS